MRGNREKSVFYILSDACERRVIIRHDLLVSPALHGLSAEQPYDLAPVITVLPFCVRRHHLGGGDPLSEPHIVLLDLVAQSPFDRISLDQPLLGPPNGYDLTSRLMPYPPLAVADRPSWTVKTETRVHAGVPLVEAEEIRNQRPDLLRRCASHFRRHFSLPFSVFHHCRERNLNRC